MNRFWFFTWRTFGTWLPGAAGFVGDFVTTRGERVTQNVPTTPTADPMPALERYAESAMRRSPVLLNTEQAAVLLPKLIAHANYRGWQLDAVAILVNHVHVVFGVPDEPDPEEMLADWKAYASRPLNQFVGWSGEADSKRKRGEKRTRPIWWERDGSTRRLKEQSHRVGAIRYVRNQDSPLAVWLTEDAHRVAAELDVAEGNGEGDPNVE
ncbi:MAG: hypothetical protein K8U57_16055 [Planctomycetes bacterium]|nr:hypothetical protein [Planctomycetota bacterium]